MTDQGFYFKRVRVHGANKPDAVVEFRDGLNIVFGPSNTGKSLILGCLDFCLGADHLQKEDRFIDSGYTHVEVVLHRRTDHAQITISRPVKGGAATATVLPEGTTTRLPKSTQKADAPTHSSYLLGLLNSEGKRIRTNQSGTTENLSIRDLARLFMVDEVQIQGTNSPVLTPRSTVTKTKEINTFKYMLNGQDDSDLVEIESAKIRKARANHQLQIIEQLLDSLNKRINTATAEIINQTQARGASNDRAPIESIIDDLHTKLEEAKQSHQKAWREDQEWGAEIITKRSLTARLQTLAKSYDTDLERLEASKQAALAMDELPSVDCALCGASPEHQSANVAEAKLLNEIIPSIQAEIESVNTLKEGLVSTIRDTNAEIDLAVAKKAAAEARLATASTAMQTFEGELKRSLEVVRQQTATICLESKVEAWKDELVEYQKQRDELNDQIDRKQEKQEFVGVSQSELMQVSASIEDMLTQWNFPGNRSTWIDPQALDAVVGGIPRASNGKGVCAVIHAAFSLALMENCMGPHSPHPQTVVLDSPLVAYKDAKTLDDESIDPSLRGLDLASHFYTDLAKRYAEAGQQVIIFENREPPDGIDARVEEFTRGSQGRYGFFPVSNEEGTPS